MNENSNYNYRDTERLLGEVLARLDNQGQHIQEIKSELKQLIEQANNERVELNKIKVQVNDIPKLKQSVDNLEQRVESLEKSDQKLGYRIETLENYQSKIKKNKQDFNEHLQDYAWKILLFITLTIGTTVGGFVVGQNYTVKNEQDIPPTLKKKN